MKKRYDEKESENVIRGFSMVLGLLSVILLIAFLCVLAIEFAL